MKTLEGITESYGVLGFEPKPIYKVAFLRTTLPRMTVTTTVTKVEITKIGSRFCEYLATKKDVTTE
ncbi:MAG: hypothetical protein ACK514_02200 [Bacteroidota bacterium]